MYIPIRLTSLKAEAGTGLGGPAVGPEVSGEQTGVILCSGQPEGKEWVERIVVERWEDEW